MKKNYSNQTNSTEFAKIDWIGGTEVNGLKKASSLFFFLAVFLLLSVQKNFAQGTNCATASPITINGACITGATMTDGTQTNPGIAAAPCATGGTFRREGWYEFTVTGGPLNITITANSADRNLALQLIGSSNNACSGTLSNLACVNADTAGNSAQTEILTYAGLANGTYWIKVVNVGNNNDMGLTSLCITSPPANDTCSGATNLTPGAACAPVTGSTAGASDNNETGDCTNGTEAAVWYKFTATTATHIVTVDGAVGFDAVIGAISSCGSATTPTGGGCTDSTLDGGIETMTLTGLTIGQIYYVQIYDYQGDLMANGFTICVQEVSPCTTPTNSPTALNLTQPTNGTINGSFTAAAPAPTNYLVVYNTTGTTPAPVNGTTYTVGGSVGAGNTVADIDSNTTFSVSGLNPATTYYFFVFSYNGGACTGGPLYKTSVPGPAIGNATTPFFYCVSNSSSSTYFINNFSTTGGTANITNNGSGYSATGYGDFTAQATSQQAFGSVNFSIALNAAYTFGVNIWVDWNNDGDFNDTGETVYASGAYINAATGTITVPGTAVAGSYRMRIVANYLSTNPAACGTISSGETEDYTFTVLPSACPGIPTAVTVGPVTSTTATVNWTASAPAPASGYQYYLTTSATLPTGATAPTGSTAAGVTTLNLSGLTANTTYYIYVRNNCGAGNVSPWTAQVSFFTGYCVSNSSSSTYFINNFSTTAGTANITNNGSGYSAGGYGNFTAQTVSQAAGGSVNFSIALNSTYTFGVNIWVDWNDDMDFNDAGEAVYASGAYVNTATGSIVVPGSAAAGNHRMRIVANYNSTNPSSCGTITSGETEDYTFNVVALPCSTFVTNILANVTTQTTATVSWTAPASAPVSGYQYYLSTATTTPTAGTAPTGSTAAGVTSVNLTGLTSATTYHIWVRTNCGGGLGQGAWVGPTDFYMPNCTIGTSNGTTTLGCPSVVSGGLGLSGADPAAITCASGGCVNLEATYLQLGNTTGYTVSSIPYNPPYQFGCLKNPVSVNVDDKWSAAVNLPFDFCYYGSTYNQCVIGSNGVLTFDMTKAGTSSGYSFSNNLPSTTGALFANTIYGVYHDIDPNVGGEVGWELITLNTGCRALVASWNDVPMFSNNALLYTGMMVLYENTNIIEVYIKNKQVDGTWNGGNAIVGVQDATGTQAVTAPGRNGLDADWTVTNEAWRFTPSGSSITSLKWYEGVDNTGTFLGSTPTLNVCPSATTTYFAEVTYTLCNGVTLVEDDTTTVTVAANKTWSGTSGTNWGTAANWSPGGVPVSTEAVVIPNTVNKPVVTGGTSAQACSLTIQNGATLTVDPNNTLTVTNAVSIAATGDLILEDTGSLVQVNNNANSGTAHIKRISKPMYKLDYSYWNSPVTTASAFAVSNLTSGHNYIYRYTPTQAGGNGTWANVGGGTAMDPTFGIIARAPITFPTVGPKQTFTTTFVGTPNNGNITMPISKGSNANMGSTAPSGGATAVVDADDEWNLIGNPYPSAIDIVSFLSDAANTPVVDGTVYLWTHNTAPSAATVDPFYGNYVLNYTVNDYATVNSLGTTTPSPSGVAPSRYIASGQSFFVSAANAMANGTTQNVTFRNTMRVANNNANFLRMANQPSHTSETFDINEASTQRVWLNLSNNNGGFSQILVGYTEGASLDWDRSFDGEALAGNAVKFYSLGADKKLTIQGRFWPFSQSDIVPLGYKATTQGNYTIGIDHLDAAFNNQDIYLEDKLLNIVHDLKATQYSFTSEAGDFDERFTIRYTNTTLGNEEVVAAQNGVVIYTDGKLNVKSSLQPIKEIMVYDVLGKLLLQNTKVNATDFMAATLQPTQSTLIVKVVLDNGAVVNKKVIF